MFSGPFTLFNDPLDFSGSKCLCASDGDSEGSPRSISTSISELLVIRWTFLAQNVDAHPMVIARALPVRFRLR
eukprot:4313801-Heterocapsa_arctica.AAC.1